jgi:hypothetical protein
MPEVDIENKNIAMNTYSRELTLSHLGVAADSYHRARANAMKQMLEALGLIDDLSNHDIVVEAKGKAEKMKKRARQ